MYEQEQEENPEDDVRSQLIQISKPKKVLHKEEFIPAKKTTRRVQKETVERTKKLNNNTAYD